MNRNSRSYASAAGAGVAAVALVFVLVYALTISTVQNSLLTGIGDAPPWKVVG